MNSTPSICSARPATIDDFEAIATLLNGIFDGHQTPLTLRWKFTGCANRLVGSTVLLCDNTVVGFLGQIPVRAVIAGREVLATQGADIAILEPFRRIDLFLTLLHASLGQLKAAGVALSYGTANASVSLTLSSLLGQRSIAALPLLVLPLSAEASSPSHPGARALTGILAAGISAAQYCAQFLRLAAGHRLRVIRVLRFDDRFDQFWQRIQRDYRVQLVRDAAYLNWRYVDAPNAVYERLCIEHASSGTIEGFVVLRLTQRGDQVRGSICDLVTPRQGQRAVAHALLAASLKWFRAHSAAIAEVWMLPGSPLRFVLRSHGFIPRSKEQYGFQASLIAPETDSPHQGIEQADDWFLAMGDSDRV